MFTADLLIGGRSAPASSGNHFARKSPLSGEAVTTAAEASRNDRKPVRTCVGRSS
jgi:hypothetical protein